MKSRRQLGIVFLLTIGLGWFLLKPSRENPTSSQTPAPLAERTPVGAIPQTPPQKKSLYQAPRPKLPIAKEDEVSGPCRALWGDLEQLDLSEALALSDKRKALPSGSGCEVPSALKRSHDEFLNNCKAFQNTGLAMSRQEWAERTANCQVSLFAYRAQITEYLTRNTPVAEISDPKILTDKLFARFITNPATAGDVAERLLEIEPGMAPAAKAAFMSRMMAAQGKSDPNLKDKMDNALKQTENLPLAERKELLEARTLFEIMNQEKPEKIGEMAKRLEQDYPELDSGPYLLAWKEYQAGNIPGAKEHLREAKRREANPRTDATLRGIEAGKKDAFQLTVSLSLDPRKYLP